MWGDYIPYILLLAVIGLLTFSYATAYVMWQVDKRLLESRIKTLEYTIDCLVSSMPSRKAESEEWPSEIHHE